MLPGVFDLGLAFTPWALGDDTHTRLGVSMAQRMKSGLSLLKFLGFTAAPIEEANDTTPGRMTIEGAPHVRIEHSPVFDCANRCGKSGQRFLAPMAHIRTLAAVSPFSRARCRRP